MADGGREGDLWLRVDFPKARVQRQFYLTPTKTVFQAVQEIRSKMEVDVGGGSFMLYIPPRVAGMVGEWMEEDELLGTYAAKLQNVVIEFRNSERPMRLQLMDNTIKSISVDRRKTVAQVIEIIGEKLGLSSVEEFGLVLPYNSADSKSGKAELLRRASTASSANAIAAASPTRSSNFIFLQTPYSAKNPKAKTPPQLWEIGRDAFLNDERTLESLGLDDEEFFIFKKKYYFHDHRVDQDEAGLLRLTFYQAMADIINSRYIVTLEQAAEFAATMLQIAFGKFNENVYKTIEIMSYLPIQFRNEEKKARKLILEHYQAMRNSDATEGSLMYDFMLKTRMLKDYGSTYYQGHEKIEKSNGTPGLRPIAVGISRDAFTLVDPESRKIIEQWPIKHLRKWSAHAKFFVCDFGDRAFKGKVIITRESRDIAMCLEGYVTLTVEKKKRAPAAQFTYANELLQEEQRVAEFAPSWDFGEEILQAAAQSVEFSRIAPERSVVQTTNVAASTSAIVQSADNIRADTLKITRAVPVIELEQEVQVAISTLKFSEDVPPGLDAPARTFQQSAIQISLDSLRVSLGEVGASFGGLFVALAAGDKTTFDVSMAKMYVQKSYQAIINSINSLRLIAVLIRPMPDELPQLIKQLSRIPGKVFDTIAQGLSSQKVAFTELCDRITGLGTVIFEILEVLSILDIDPNEADDLQMKAGFIETTCTSLVFEPVNAALANTSGITNQKLVEFTADVKVSYCLLMTVLAVVAPVLVNDDVADIINRAVQRTEDSISTLQTFTIKNTPNAAAHQAIQIQFSAATDRIDKVKDQIETMRRNAKRKSGFQLPQAIIPTSGAALVPFMISIALQLEAKIDDTHQDPSVLLSMAKDLTTAASRLNSEFRDRSTGEEVKLLCLEVHRRCSRLSGMITRNYLNVIRATEDVSTSTTSQFMMHEAEEVLQKLRVLSTMIVPNAGNGKSNMPMPPPPLSTR